MDILQVQVQRGETTEAKRTIPLYIVEGSGDAAYLTPKTGFTGKVAQLQKNFGASGDSTNDMIECEATDAPGLYSLVLELDEVDEGGWLTVTAKVSGQSAYGMTVVQIVDFDPFSEGAKSSLAQKYQSSKPV